MSFLEQTRARVPRLADAVTQRRARLSVVGGSERRAPRLPFAVFVLTVVGLGLLGLLVLNTSLQHQAFYARSLEQHADELALRKQALIMDVDTLRSPDRVARKAQALGMLPNHSPAFLFLADGTVRGTAVPADPATALRLDAKPPADPLARKVKKAKEARDAREAREARETREARKKRADTASIRPDTSPGRDRNDANARRDRAT